MPNETHGTEPVRRMSIYRQNLYKIAHGAKTVEVRVSYPKNRSLTPGQFLEFFSGDETCLTRITRVTEYSSFAEMLDAENPDNIGFTAGETRAGMLAAIRAIYS